MTLSQLKKQLIVFFIIASTFVNAQTKYKSVLQSEADFNALKTNPITNKYGNVDALKVAFDIKDNKLYFINSKTFKYHFNFCKGYLEIPENIKQFNSANYKAQHPNKRFLLGNINHYLADDSYNLELSPIDEMQIEDIKIFYEAIQKATYFKTFNFFLNTSRLEKLKSVLQIPTQSASDLYGNQTYQAVSTHKSYGCLKFVSVDSLKHNNISKYDIIVIDQPILELPITAGVITTILQTPLSHISVLGKNRQIPIAAYTKAMQSDILKGFDNQYVSFEVAMDTFYIKPISKEQFERKTKKKKKDILFLEKNTTVKTLINADDLNSKLVNTVGGKAANFGVLYDLAKNNNFKVPESAFAIPFYYYEAHLKASGADRMVKDMIYNYRINQDKNVLTEQLKAIQKTIKKTPIDPDLITKVEAKIIEIGDFKRMRFRSSTNAEDIVGFSGAGLYDSKTGIVGDSIKTIEKAIKKVWSSLWYERAFLEREYFNIDQNSIAMGVLVHRSFPNEKANGVAITKNLYRKQYLGNVINVQLGEASVVQPEDGVTCDQIICYSGSSSKLYNDKRIVEIISHSNLNNGELVMSEAEIIHLSEQLEKIKKHYYYNVYKSKKKYLDFGLDIEFKLMDEDRKLYIKQVRYFND
ncbi:PEP/pyruvate-binding domain-containing protein [Olleya sp. YS]|uniref:PEP/pyruvate-binding domain-containing protein n=1 Tax=Olleya sp. YS TaxID=3028318 RepID=UPI0024341F14|nr:PEP/pyruvate-binding domain-containing protein [Olleya sp. YS]WGD34768.1 PEP/pyruvate-binding domain-containing protein [Olleya sp. YS]